MKTFPYYVANVAEAPNADLEVTDKYSGEVAYRVAMADATTIDRAIAAATEAAAPLRKPGGEWRVVDVEVLEEPLASDHRPLLAVLEWRKR